VTEPLGIWHEPRMIGSPPPTPAPVPRERLLVVEDDPEIRAMVAAMLSERGYDVLHAGDGRDMERLLHREQLDLVILDLMLPGEDGVSLCRRLRTRYGVPILMLTAIGAETDRIVGLESGADDYMVKPFAPRELLARVRALLRRTGRHKPPSPETLAAYEFAGWELNLVRLTLTAPGGALVPLTNAEYTLLVALCARAGDVVSREALLARGDTPPVAAYDRSVDTLIVRLRRKLAAHVAAGPDAEMIRTVRNAGYVFLPEVTQRTRGGAS
jgi:two-component system OmpR family response regulator